MSSEKSLTKVTICLGSSCFSRGNREHVGIINDAIAQNHLEDQVQISGTHCVNKCHCGPHILVNDKEYQQVEPDDLRKVIKKMLSKCK